MHTSITTSSKAGAYSGGVSGVRGKWQLRRQLRHLRRWDLGKLPLSQGGALFPCELVQLSRVCSPHGWAGQWCREVNGAAVAFIIHNNIQVCIVLRV